MSNSDIFTLIYSVLGGLGIFFYGMKGMSDGLQAVAGDVIKNIINGLTSNRVLAVIVGCFVTMLVQSSSVTTVMVVGFVNAGLMQLTQAIGVIFGANIGTTVTGWIISIKVGKYGLLLIGLGIFPALFAKTNKWKHIGRILFSVGMIFFGLQIMSTAFKPLRTNQDFISMLSYFAEPTYLSYIACAAMGCLLTIIIQSSSAMLGITIALAVSGVINFQTAAALVLGENIGTTITALLASVGGNVNAKRAARAHAIFNLLGVAFMIAIFPVYIQFIEWLIPGAANLVNAAGDRPNIAVHIATSHTVFNVTATILFLPFLRILSGLVTKITPDKEVKEQHHLEVLGNPADMLPATALVQANTELIKLGDIVGRMFKVTAEYVSSDDNDTTKYAKIKDYESITDNIQKEITIFVGQLMEKSLSPVQSKEAQGLVRVASELESVADYLEKISFFKTRFNKENTLKGESRKRLIEFFDRVHDFYLTVNSSIESGEMDIAVHDRQSETLRICGEEIRDRQIEELNSSEYSPLLALTYADMIEGLKKTRSHIHNVGQAMSRMTV